MISKYSVKKPLTIIMALLAVILLGYVSFSHMKTDLLPNMDLPYIAIITPYGGATSEKVEASLTKPLEQILAQTNGVVEMQSISAENYSFIIMEFSQGTNLDSAIIEISSSANQVTNALDDDMVSSPIFMKINPDLLPVVIASVDIENTDRIAAAEKVNDDIIPALERTDGVASVTAMGIVDNIMKITIDDGKIDELNDKIVTAIDDTLADAEKKLDDAQKELDKGKKELEKAKKEQNENLAKATVLLQNGITQLYIGKNTVDTTITLIETADEYLMQADRLLFDAEKETSKWKDIRPDVRVLLSSLKTALSTAYNGIDAAIEQLDKENENYDDIFSSLDSLRSKLKRRIARCDELIEKVNSSATPKEVVKEVRGLILDLHSSLRSLKKTMKQTQEKLGEQADLLKEQQETLESGKFTYTQEITLAQVKLDNAQAQLDEGKKAFEEAKQKAYEAAGLDGAISVDTISALITAENFSMPVGTINDNNVTYAVKVGDVFEDNTELENWELFNITAGDIGIIKLSDIAKIEYLDTSGDIYAKVNGNDGIILSIDKLSTYSTTDVAHNIAKTTKSLEKQYDGLKITTFSDQGEYIDLVIGSVLEALLMGGGLAILILLIFLRDFKPTLIIAISIPASLLFAMVLMYFTGVSLNIISLAGLALGVGMLVDNSIVVVENIYRVKALGLPIKQACIDGAKQVGGAIIASTLTTVSVFLPIVFTTGITKQLFTDMGLTICYSLMASLIVALTLVPALSSLILQKTKERKAGLFDRITDGYAKLLSHSLSHKAISLVLVMLLFGLSIFGAFQMGTEFIPESNTKQMSVSLEMPLDTTVEQAREISENVVDILMGIDDIETVAAMQGGSGMLAMMSTRGSSANVSIYLLLKKNRTHTSQQVAEIIKEQTKDVGCIVSVSSSAMNMSMLTGEGLSIQIKGTNLDDLQEAARGIGAMLEGIEGTTDVKTGLEDATDEIRIIVDKNKAMAKGYTIAQIYMKVAEAVTTQKTATSIQIDKSTVSVLVSQSEDKNMTVEDLKNLELEIPEQMGSAESMAVFSQTDETDSDDTTSSDGESEKEMLRLSDIAEIVFTDAPKSITHINQVRTMTVTASIDKDHNIGKVSNVVNEKIKAYQFPGDTYYEADGENEYINTALRDLAYMIIISVALIYMIMVAQFQSLKSPFIVMFTIPLAFTGGLLFVWILGFNLSVIAMLGFLVLSGVVVNNGIVFVDYANQLIEGGMDVRTAMIETGRARIRPIIMTAITTILGLTTIALAIGEGTDMVQPMAIVVIGGLLYATLLTLFVIPVLYEMFNKKRH